MYVCINVCECVRVCACVCVCVSVFIRTQKLECKVSDSTNWASSQTERAQTEYMLHSCLLRSYHTCSPFGSSVYELKKTMQATSACRTRLLLPLLGTGFYTISGDECGRLLQLLSSGGDISGVFAVWFAVDVESLTCATIFACADESALVLAQKNWKTFLHTVSTGNRTHGNCCHRIFSAARSPHWARVSG